MSEQEMIARIIDPRAWSVVDQHAPYVARHTLPRERERLNSLAKAAAILTTLEASRTPEGMVMVPREPTEAMLVKGYTAYHAGATNAPDLWRNIWAAMISATPTPSGAE